MSEWIFYLILANVAVLVPATLWHRRLKGAGAGAQRLAQHLTRVPTWRDLRRQARMELNRARRYQRPFSVVLLYRPVSFPAGSNGKGLSLEHVQFALLGALLREALRETDLVAFDPARERFILALAESDRETAEKAISRLRRLLRERQLIVPLAGLAAFPQDGLTLDELMEAAERRGHRGVGNGKGVSRARPLAAGEAV